MVLDKNSKTAKNLAFAFAGESQARNKYTYFASQARKDGYQQIAEIFDNTAANEKEHAELWFKALNGGEISDTKSNLAAAAAGEHEEWTEMYKNFAAEAEKEGYTELAHQFKRVAAIEERHEKRYRKFLENVEKNQVFDRKEPKRWECRNCGHVYIGDKAPEKCPTCGHPRAFFEIEAENY
ncbi:MAG: rubrerythrin family protein [Planctomycetota bacterium]|jgi:rubrerythrin|nr:rubrerythrin family protein [Planctomycetota bacterium]